MPSLSDLLQATKHRFFTNRETEIHIFEQMVDLSDSTYTILVIRGVGGIGKSMLLEKYCQLATNRSVPYIIFNSAEHKTVEDIFEKFRITFAQHNHLAEFTDFFVDMQRLDNLLTQTHNLSTSDTTNLNSKLSDEDQTFIKNAVKIITPKLIAAVNALIQKFNQLILLFDTYEVIPTEIDKWLCNQFLNNLLQGTYIIIATRSKLLAWWDKWLPLTKQIELLNFEKDHALKYLNKRGIKQETLADELFAFTFGHPLCLAISSDIQNQQTPLNLIKKEKKSDPDKFFVVDSLVERVMSHISDPLIQKLIEIGAILRFFNVDTLQHFLSTDEIAADLAWSALKTATIESKHLYKRWHKLKLKEAKFGPLHCPPEIQIEIEDIEQKLDTLKNLEELANKSHIYASATFGLNQLKQFSFLVLRTKGFALHDIVREYISLRLKHTSPARFADLNHIAISWYKHLQNTATGFEKQKLLLEILYHSLHLDEQNGISLFENLFEEAYKSYKVWFCQALINEIETFSFVNLSLQNWVDYAKSQLAVLENLWEKQYQFLKKLLSQTNLNKHLRMRVFVDIASYHRRQGHVTTALPYLEKGLELAEQNNHTVIIWWALFEQSKIHRTLGNWLQAIAALQKGLTIAKQTKDKSWEAKTLLHLGPIYHFQGQWDKAIALYQQALTLFEELEEEYSIGRTHFNFAWTIMHQGQWDKAEYSFKKCLNISEKLGLQHSSVSALMGLAELYRRKVAFKTAKTYLDKSLQIAINLNYQVYLGQLHHIKANLHKDQAEWQLALQNYNQSLELHTINKAHFLAGVTHVSWGYMELNRLEITSAQQHFIQAITIFQNYSSLFHHNMAKLGQLRCNLYKKEINQLTLKKLDDILFTATDANYFQLAAHTTLTKVELILMDDALTNKQNPTQILKQCLEFAEKYNPLWKKTFIQEVNNRLNTFPNSQQLLKQVLN